MKQQEMRTLRDQQEVERKEAASKLMEMKQQRYREKLKYKGIAPQPDNMNVGECVLYA